MRISQWLCVLAAFLVTGEAAAQTANPVTAHYRAYREAFEAGDVAAAETAATAALEASIARDGDGGNTAVLAINLAQARLMLGRRADAYEPAQRAFTIASAGNSSVDPLMARLVLGRAQLTVERGDDGRRLLERAIEDAETRTDLRTERYIAAADLGRWLFADEQFPGAIRAWTIAGELVDAAEGDVAYARAEARLGVAAAQMANAMLSVIREQARPTDTRLSTNAYTPFREADEALAEAQLLMAPYAFVPGENGGLTLGQRIYAHTVAWRSMGRAFLEARGHRPLPDFERNITSDGSVPTCEMTTIAEPRPSFPTGAQSAFAVGAAVVRFNISAEGRSTDVAVAASVPERWFLEAVERVSPQWRAEVPSNSPGSCRFEGVFYQVVIFRFR